MSPQPKILSRILVEGSENSDVEHIIMTESKIASECGGCNADESWLRRIETFPLHGKEVSQNPVFICSKCGTIMVQLGFVGGKRGLAVHPAIPNMGLDESE